MIVRIPGVLSANEVSQLHKILETAEFVDGKLTAGWYAKKVVHDHQFPDNAARTIRDTVHTALYRNPLFQAAVHPKQIHSISVSRYNAGMADGRQADNALMKVGDNQWRSDVSFTVFLNDPNTYDGGELVIEGVDDERAYKLEAGMAIAYPSSTLYRVDPILKGMRLVATGWVQSWVRDPTKREILFELDTVRRSLLVQHGKTNEFDLLSKNIANLLRQWAE
ncbi:MAG: Fe2+-dependent dioxygenase [Cyanobacteria bacterium P01_F01_bin.150]